LNGNFEIIYRKIKFKIFEPVIMSLSGEASQYLNDNSPQI